MNDGTNIELPAYTHCPWCGATLERREVEGRIRPICEHGHIVYVNPMPATCQVVIDRGRVLLTLRAVEPQAGMWCLPGGFIEWGESSEDAARRELAEETGVIAGGLSLVGVYSSISGKARHVLLIAFRVMEWSGTPVAGDDAAEVRWWPLDAIPELAFASHVQALRDTLREEEL